MGRSVGAFLSFSIFVSIISKHSIIDSKEGVIQMKKIQHRFTLILVLCSIPFLSSNVSAAQVFTDLDRVEWAKDEIYYLSGMKSLMVMEMANLDQVIKLRGNKQH